MTQLTPSLRTVLYLSLAFLFSCSQPHTKRRMQSGMWEIFFDIGEEMIPIRLYVENDTTWKIINAEEQIVLKGIQWDSTRFHVKMPFFNSVLNGENISPSEMRGNWKDNSRDGDYTIPFVARFKSLEKPTELISTEKRTFEVMFSPENPSESTRAVGVFQYNKNRIWGTFLTESGDFRYLEGQNTGKSMYLSCFDGAHLFYFCANIAGDSLTDGMFYSGKHWSEEWEGVLNPSARLRNPDSLTVLKNPGKSLTFSAMSLSGDSVDFDQSDFKGKVSIVQIFGSWCPNCTDESVYLRELFGKYNQQGLQIIPVGFERASQFETAKQSIENQFAELHLPYQPYIGGTSSKTRASEVFADLNDVSSYPTTIFIDKRGRVRKIHTGFYGPGTGDLYKHHCDMLDMFVAQLLSE